jgi:redox-sensitive bicupin YhaK (pirin superfamily)
MSNTGLIIEERSRDIGSFLVGRLIPFRKKRMVGPFIFIDHMGPSKVSSKGYLDVGEHPHIGLSTLTYLLEGAILHKDSIGSNRVISPGSVNWMTAGSGVVHTERTPKQMRDGKEYPLHGFQIWVALPKELEEIEPSFHHIAESELPKWEENGISYTLVAGKGYGKESPVPVHSELFMVELKSDQKQVFCTGNNLVGEIGICIVSGYIEACGERIEKGNMLISNEEDICEMTIGEKTHLLVFGGKPLPEKRFIHWNFVSSSQERIDKAKADWENKNFEMVEGEDDYVPMPK